MKRRAFLQNLMAAGAVFAQRADHGDPDYTVRSDVRLVLLDVGVRNRQGTLVSGLVKENFTVLEDGRPKPITVFAHDDVPVTVGILVDESASMRPKRSEVLSSANAFIEESNPRDEMFVLNFNDTVTRGLPESMMFSDSRRQLKEALHRGMPHGKTALNDALAESFKLLRLGRREKKAVVLISDGGDNASERTKREILSMAERSTAIVYSIGIYDEGDPDRDPGVLRLLASVSGGEAHFPQTPAETGAVCRRIAKDIRARYTVGYIPDPGKGAGGVRHIAVRVSSPEYGKLTAATRTRYVYESQAPEIL